MDTLLISVLDALILLCYFRVVHADKHVLSIVLDLKETVFKVQSAAVLMDVEFALVLDSAISAFPIICPIIWVILTANTKIHSHQYSSLICLLHLQVLL